MPRLPPVTSAVRLARRFSMLISTSSIHRLTCLMYIMVHVIRRWVRDMAVDRRQGGGDADAIGHDVSGRDRLPARHGRRGGAAAVGRDARPLRRDPEPV